MFLTGSRKSFISLLTFFSGIYFIFSEGSINLKLIRLFISVSFLFLIYFLFVGESVVVQRLVESFTASLSASSEFDIADGRAIQYVYSIQYFIDNPILGIGLGNYQAYDIFNLVLHSEFLVQLVECGLIGFGLFILFNLSIYRKIKFLKIKKVKSLFKLYYIIYVFLCLGTWTFNIMIFWIVPPIIIAILNFENIKL